MTDTHPNISTDDITLIAWADWYDGPISGMARWKDEAVWFTTVSDAGEEPRRYALHRLCETERREAFDWFEEKRAWSETRAPEIRKLVREIPDETERERLIAEKGLALRDAPRPALTAPPAGYFTDETIAPSWFNHDAWHPLTSHAQNVTEDTVLMVLSRIETGNITLTPDEDPQIKTKGDILYRASNGWTIEVSNWSGEFAGIVEIGLPDGSVLDADCLEDRMPAVSLYFPDYETAWRIFGMKPIDCGFIYQSDDKMERFAGAKDGDVISNPDDQPPWIVVSNSLQDVTVARWPGRLWLAQVLRKLEPQGHRGNYVRCISVRLIRELSPHHLFGQHGEAVSRVLDYARKLSLAQAEQLAAERHDEAEQLAGEGWHRWQETVKKTPSDRSDDMRRVLVAANNLRAPTDYALSVAHSCVWEAARNAVGNAAFEEDDDEAWMITPWSEAFCAIAEAIWALGSPELFSDEEIQTLTQAWRMRREHA